MPRVAYVNREDADPNIRQMFEKWEADGYQVLNLYKVVAKTPQIGKQFIRLGNRILLQGSVPPRLREFAILRVGDLAKAPYEFSKHVDIGRKTGISAVQIAALPAWRESDLFDAAERAVLQFTDEVTLHYRARDDTFAALREHLDEAQVTELTITIGYYGMVCRVLEALQVELEDEAFVPF